MARTSSTRRSAYAGGLLVAVLTVAGAGGCTDREPAPVAEVISIERSVRYASLPEITSHSTVVVLATVTASKEEPYGDIPTTVSSIAVTSVLVGEAPATTLQVQQIGSATVRSPETSPLLRVGAAYLLFLSDKGMTEGRFVVTGDDGIYRKDNDRYVFAGGPQAAVPAILIADEVTAAALTPR